MIKTNCKSINFKNIIFHKTTDFTECIFEKGGRSNEIIFTNIIFKNHCVFRKSRFKGKLIFQNVTFEDQCNFKNTYVNYGIDLDDSNIQKEINFFDIYFTNLAKKNTSQETFRIIKYQFEKIGNKIESNIYHSLELEKRKENLKLSNKVNFFDRAVFFINWGSSRFGTRGDLPIYWMLFISLLTTLIMNIHQIDILINIKTFPTFLDFFYKFLQEIFKYMSILTKRKDFEGNYILFFITKISLGYLYYQFIISVRKDTRKYIQLFKAIS